MEKDAAHSGQSLRDNLYFTLLSWCKAYHSRESVRDHTHLPLCSAAVFLPRFLISVSVCGPALAECLQLIDRSIVWKWNALYYALNLIDSFWSSFPLHWFPFYDTNILLAQNTEQMVLTFRILIFSPSNTDWLLFLVSPLILSHVTILSNKILHFFEVSGFHHIYGDWCWVSELKKRLLGMRDYMCELI